MPPGTNVATGNQLESTIGLDANVSFLEGYYAMIPGISISPELGRYHHPEPIEQVDLTPTPPLAFPVYTTFDVESPLSNLSHQQPVSGAMDASHYASNLHVPTSMPAPLDPGHSYESPKDNFRLTKQCHPETCEGRWMSFSDIQAGTSKSDEECVAPEKCS